jgi:hypothetical protein
VTRKEFEARIRELVAGQATLERIAGAMLSARSTLKAEYEKLHKAVLSRTQSLGLGTYFAMGPYLHRADGNLRSKSFQRAVATLGRPFPSATLPIAGACRFLVRLPAARILFGLSHDQSPAVQRPPCRA